MAATEDKDKYEHSVDVICEGSGVAAIGLAGTYAALEAHGYQPQNVAGTSAGAITAALITAGYKSAQPDEIILGLDFTEFEDDASQHRIPLVDTPLRILFTEHLYKGDAFLEWIRARLVDNNVHTFRDLRTDSGDARYSSKLRVIASGLAVRLRRGRDPRVADVRPPPRRARPEDPDHRANPRSGERAARVQGARHARHEHGAHDVRGARPPLSRAARFARTISTPTLGAGTTEFDLKDRANVLYESGRSAAEKLIEPLELLGLHRPVPKRQNALAAGVDRRGNAEGGRRAGGLRTGHG